MNRGYPLDFYKSQKYYDDNLKGFGVRVTSGGTKAFFVEKLINKKLSRITIGRYPEISPDLARKKATELLGQIAMGKDPVAEKRTDSMRTITLNEVFHEYLKTRKTLKPKTISNYTQIINKAFPSWKSKPILSITKDRISKHHEKLGNEHGEAYANWQCVSYVPYLILHQVNTKMHKANH